MTPWNSLTNGIAAGNFISAAAGFCSDSTLSLSPKFPYYWSDQSGLPNQS